MSETAESLRRKIKSARDLQSVVRTMKALAASSIGQYERALRALGDYYRSVEMGLSACLRQQNPTKPTSSSQPNEHTGEDSRAAVVAVVFGSDQGLVGRFNEVVTDYAIVTFGKRLQARRAEVWAVGERVHSQLVDGGARPMGLFTVPSSVKTITPLVGEILVQIEMHHGLEEAIELDLFYNHLKSGATYAPVRRHLLPLDDAWRDRLIARPWPTSTIPEVMGSGALTLRALIREYLFVLLFRASAESLASENASRLTAMQRADKNIDELLEDLDARYHQLRQSGIDAELFDLVSGFEALKDPRPIRTNCT